MLAANSKTLMAGLPQCNPPILFLTMWNPAEKGRAQQLDLEFGQGFGLWHLRREIPAEQGDGDDEEQSDHRQRAPPSLKQMSLTISSPLVAAPG
jgi:hypothetical protein